MLAIKQKNLSSRSHNFDELSQVSIRNCLDVFSATVSCRKRVTTQRDFLITKWLRNVVVLINSVAVTNNELEATETLNIHLGCMLFFILGSCRH